MEPARRVDDSAAAARKPGRIGLAHEFRRGPLHYKASALGCAVVELWDHHGGSVPRTSGLRRVVAPGRSERPEDGSATPPLVPPADHLDRLIHERLRLGIISALTATPVLSFTDLKKLLKTTDGNLSVHARKLEEAGYIACFKSFDGRTPRTEFRLTPAGKAALLRYLDHMDALIQATRKLTTAD